MQADASGVKPLAAPEGIELALLDLRRASEATLLPQLTLSTDEQQRLATLKNPIRRRDWLAGRWLARQLLGELSSQPVSISAGDGKPNIESNPPLFCNWSHSGDWLLAAATALGPIGCDIEVCKPRTKLDSLIKKSFAEGEATALLAMNEPQRRNAFFALWTLKEAALKADGIGIGRGLKKPEFHWNHGWLPLTADYQFYSDSLITSPSGCHWAVAWEPKLLSPD